MLDNVEVTVLDNGCRVVTSRLPGIESVAVGLYAKVGSRYEKPEHAGHSHFLEHMLFKGSEKRTARAISQAIESRGGHVNAYTNFETTAYYAAVPAQALPTALDVLGDMYLAPRLDTKEINKERTVILEELNMYHDQPDSFAMDLAQQSLWSRHPLGSEIIGNQKSLAMTNGESLRSYHQAHYNAHSTVIAAAGKLEHGAFVELASQYASRLPNGRPGKFKGATDATRRTQMLVDRRETEQVQAVMSFRTFGRRDPRRFVENILNLILGGNMSSRLFQVVREKHGLAYSVSSSVSMYEDTGAFQVMAGLDRKRSVKAVALCAAELSRIVAQKVSKAELNRAVEYITGGMQIGLETSRSQMSWIANGTLHNNYMTPAEAIARTKAVAVDDVIALAKEIFTPANATLALVMPRTDVGEPAEHLEAMLAAL